MKTFRMMALLVLAGAPLLAPARTKLVTLPERAQLVTSLENPNSTLLYEERIIPLQKGTNQIDFAWNGVQVDASSVMIELMGDGKSVTAAKLISTAIPPNEAALTWEIYSPTATAEKIRVSYILSGISRGASYELSVNKEEAEGDLRQFTLLQNQSGENLTDSILRLPAQEDLTRTLASGESRRFETLRNKTLPIQKLFIARPDYYNFKGEEGESIALVYEFKNMKEAGLGLRKLEAGKVRIFGDDGMESSIFLGEDNLMEVPPQEKAELTLGTVKDVTLKRRLTKNERSNIRTNTSRNVVLFDQVRGLRYEVENFKAKPVTLRIEEQLQGDWEISSKLPAGVTATRKSIDTLLVDIALPARKAGVKEDKQVIDLEVLVRNRFPSEN